MKTEKETPGMARRDLLKRGLAAATIAAAGAIVTGGRCAFARQETKGSAQRAVDHFMKSMNCSQAVLEVYGPALGLPAEAARRVATGFAGGMGTGSECGAVTGALMVLGLKFGPDTDKTMRHVATFIQEFKKKHGATSCSRLLGVDMGTPEGVQKAVQQGLFTSACPRFVRTAADLAERLSA
jgi:C_GCAxxG_C_C family probable redox protein